MIKGEYVTFACKRLAVMLYPTSFTLHNLSQKQLQLKVARHSQCDICQSACDGLRPPSDVLLTLDSGDQQHFSNDDDDRDVHYLNVCTCGHSCSQHGADSKVLGHSEFNRRALVAIRIDELLHVRGHVLEALNLPFRTARSSEDMRIPAAVALASVILLSIKELRQAHSGIEGRVGGSPDLHPCVRVYNGSDFDMNRHAGHCSVA